MQYSRHLLLKTYIVIFTATSGTCWQYFTSLTDTKLFNSKPEDQYIHSEYLFGQCRVTTNIFYTHAHLDHISVLGKTIVRGWIDVFRIPTCILMRGKAHESHLVRSTSFAFQLCVPRITYCHSQNMYKYHYFELYVPFDMIGGMDWDLYFFGPPTAQWW